MYREEFQFVTGTSLELTLCFAVIVECLSCLNIFKSLPNRTHYDSPNRLDLPSPLFRTALVALGE